MRLCTITLIVGLALLLVSCSHNVTDDDGAGVEVFPSQIGTTWTYRWHDYANDTVDTVVVSVTGTTMLPGLGEASILVYDHPDWTETVYLSARGDTVEFLPEGGLMANAARFLLPLEVGGKWPGVHPYSLDTCWVSSREPVTVPLGTFPDAFYAQEVWGFPWVFYGWVATWVVPEVGVVRELRHVVSPRVRYHRELIAFERADS